MTAEAFAPANTATRRNTPHHAAIQCNTVQLTAIHCNAPFCQRRKDPEERRKCSLPRIPKICHSCLLFSRGFQCSWLKCASHNTLCCRVLQCVAMRCSMGQNVHRLKCCSVLQCVAVCCSVLYQVLMLSCGLCIAIRGTLKCFSVLQCVAVRCSVLQRVAACCSVLQTGSL